MKESKKKKFDYFTPTQILERNPKIAKKWNVREIGYLLMLQLVRGKKLKRGCLVSESDVINLLNYNYCIIDN